MDRNVSGPILVGNLSVVYPPKKQSRGWKLLSVREYCPSKVFFDIFCVAVRLPERATLCPCVGRVSCCIGLRGLITPYVHVHGVYFFKYLT